MVLCCGADCGCVLLCLCVCVFVQPKEVAVGEGVPSSHYILDIGPETIKELQVLIPQENTHTHRGGGKHTYTHISLLMASHERTRHIQSTSSLLCLSDPFSCPCLCVLVVDRCVSDGVLGRSGGGGRVQRRTGRQPCHHLKPHEPARQHGGRGAGQWRGHRHVGEALWKPRPHSRQRRGTCHTHILKDGRAGRWGKEGVERS